MSLSPGNVVRARVKHVAVFGVFLDYEGEEILVRIPETSWTVCYASCQQLAAVGDEFDVMLLGRSQARNQFDGSFKMAHPESDPWSGRWTLQIGDRLQATVVRFVEHADRCGDGPGYLLELRPATYTMLCASMDEALTVGSTCEVVVTVVNPGRLEVRIERA